jgi:hypothetical protein
VAAAARTISKREELDRWYCLHLRPMVARAAEQSLIDPVQAAAFELAMAELVSPRRGHPPRLKGANPNGQ